MKNNKLKINWKLPFYGALGFTIGFVVGFAIVEVIGFTICKYVGISIGIFIMNEVYGAIIGAIGGAALGLALKDKKKTLYLALAGAIGFAIAFVIGFFFTNLIIRTFIIGAIVGAALGLALKDKRKTLYLALAGAIGNGIVYIITGDTFIGEVISSIVMGAALGLALAYIPKERVSLKKKAEISDEKDPQEWILEILPEGKYKEELFEKFVEEGWPKGRKIMAERYIHKMWFGGGLFFIGTILTLVGYFTAISSPGGGEYYIYYGMIGYGIWELIKGFLGWREYKD